MAKSFITGSSAGLGLLAAQLLIEPGHAVVLHGRDQAKAEVAMRAAPGAQATPDPGGTPAPTPPPPTS